MKVETLHNYSVFHSGGEDWLPSQSLGPCPLAEQEIPAKGQHLPAVLTVRAQ